ncbi:hypothetical protein MKC53_04380 [[Clostridium] innocuum]|nr:hypothetical protein [[Clostridium] innocuum]
MAVTKAKAIHDFFNSVMTSYPASAVPDDAAMPYLTYTWGDASFGDEPQSFTVYIYDRTESEAEINALARKLSDAIGRGGRMVRCDDGAIWLQRGTPWCQVAPYDDKSIKRRYINVTAVFFTID